MAWMTDTNAHAPIGIAAMLRYGPQAVMPGVTAIQFHAHFARRKIKLVMKDDDVR